MKKNRIALLITLALLVIAAILLVTNSYTTLRRGVSEFAVDDTAAVRKIFLADKNNNEVTLERQADGSWTVNGRHLAQQAKITSFLKTLQDLEVRSPVPLAARDNVIRRMASLAKKVEIYQVVPRINFFNLVRLFPHEKKVKTYYVGDVTQDNQGTFMLMEGSEEPFVVHIPGFRGFVSTRYSTKASDWRDYTVFRNRIGDIAAVKLEFLADPAESYRMEVTDNRNISLFSLDPEQLIAPFDTIRVVSFLAAFEDVRFESLLADMLEPAFIDSVKASPPRTIITLTDRSGHVNQVKLFKKRGFQQLYAADEGMALEPMDIDRAYALVNDGEDFVLVQYYVFDRVTRPLSYFRGN